MAFLYIGPRRLRMRRAILNRVGLKPKRWWHRGWGHRASYQYEVSFERGTAIGTGQHRSFLIATAISIYKTYTNMLYQRRLDKNI